MTCHPALKLAIVFLLLSKTALGELIINLNASDSDVQISWSGSGTTLADLDSSLEFVFNGSPFLFPKTSTPTLPMALRVDGSFLPNLYDAFSITTASTLQFSDSLGLVTGIASGSFYQALQPQDGNNQPITVTLPGVTAADLIAGEYTSTAGDAAAFGTVTLVIGSASIPEPSHFLLAAGILIVVTGVEFTKKRPQG